MGIKMLTRLYQKYLESTWYLEVRQSAKHLDSVCLWYDITLALYHDIFYDNVSVLRVLPTHPD